MFIECTQLNSTSALQEAFVKLVTILSGLASIDISINNFNRGNNTDKWYFETLINKCQCGLDEPTNNWIFKHCLVADVVYDRKISPAWHCNNAFLDYLELEYRLFYEMASKARQLLETTEGQKRIAELRLMLTAATKNLEPDDAARITGELLAHMVIEGSWQCIFIQILREDFDLEHNRDLAGRFNDDIEIVKTVLAQRGDLLACVSNRLRNDPDLVLLANRNYFYAFKYAGSMAKNNEALLRKVIEENPLAMIFATESLKNDKDFVLPLLLGSPGIYTSLSKRLKSDPDIQAVAKNKKNWLRAIARW